MKQIDGYKIYLNQMLGKGSFGSVYIGASDSTGQKVAVKILSKSDIDADEYLKNALFSQIKIMQSVKSENVVGFYDVMESSKNYYIVQELCDGDLSALMKGGNKINQNQAKDYLKQIANGFLALVREGIIHRDLKPANIMTKGKQLKIGDFGFAKKTDAFSTVKNQTIVGTPLYMSLQILKSQPYSSKCDIWALGFIYYQMLHGYPPWNGKSQYDLIKKIETKPLDVDSQFSAQTKDFLKKCLQVTEQKRISWDQLFTHSIFNNYFINKSKGGQQFENKLKMIMADLRFQINSQNLDLCKILASLGYKNGQAELCKNKFYKFLQIISPDITRDASDYIFNKTDYNKNGSISINQIEKIMNQNNINLSTIYNKVPGFSKNQNGSQSFTTLNPEIQNKIKACFAKLMRDIMWNNSSLKQIFNKFDAQKKGKMSALDFRKMILSISKDITQEQIRAAFDLIDVDGSKTVQFNQLNNYYLKVNGISANQNNNLLNSTQMVDQSKKSEHLNKSQPKGNNYNGMQNQFNAPNMNQAYPNYPNYPMMQGNNYPQPPIQQYNNPLNALMGQQPPQFPNHNTYNYYNQYPGYSQQQQQQHQQQHQQQQQQKSGGYDNFILNTLSQNVNNSYQGPW